MLESPESGLKNKEKYVIWPPDHFLSHENYGIVIYGVYKDYKDYGYDSSHRILKDRDKDFEGDYAELLNIINEWINNEALGKKAYKEKIEPFTESLIKNN